MRSKLVALALLAGSLGFAQNPEADLKPLTKCRWKTRSAHK